MAAALNLIKSFPVFLLRPNTPSPTPLVRPFTLKTTPFRRPSSYRYATTGVDPVDDVSSGGRELVGLSDEKLLSQCEMDTYKSSGPGGQHRNKRETAVRLKHLPTGIISQGMQALLDLIFAVEGSVADAAKKLGYGILSTGALSRLILSDDSLRQAVNEFRTSKHSNA
ncbi:BEACH domain-containing protein C2 [Tanacetum coccineum]